MNDSSMKAKFEQLQAFRETLTRATNRDEMTANYRAVMDKRRELGMPNHGRKYDYDWIVKHASLVLDTINAAKHVSEGREKIVRIGEALPLSVQG